MRRNNCARGVSGETSRIGGQATSGTSPGTHPEAIPLRHAASRGRFPLAGKCPYGGQAEVHRRQTPWPRGMPVNDRPTGSERQINCNRVTRIILPLGEGARECAEREDCAFTTVLSWRWLWNGCR